MIRTWACTLELNLRLHFKLMHSIAWAWHCRTSKGSHWLVLGFQYDESDLVLELVESSFMWNFERPVRSDQNFRYWIQPIEMADTMAGWLSTVIWVLTFDRWFCDGWKRKNEDFFFFLKLDLVCSNTKLMQGNQEKIKEQEFFFCW